MKEVALPKVLRQAFPKPAKVFIRHLLKNLDNPILQWHLRHTKNTLHFLPYSICPKPTIHFAKICNALSNAGAVPLVREFSSSHEVLDTFPNAGRRQLGIEGFEGFGVDDAVFDDVTQHYELRSNAALAEVIASFSHANYQNPSVLELGCGPAHLFFFLRRYGIRNYVGIDGNPYFVKFNRLLRGYEQHFLILNLQQEIALDDGAKLLEFDVVCSFEVLEHIREDAVDNFIRTIRNHMHARSVAFCTASLQANMDVHVLIRDREWWLERFAKFGLYPRLDETDIVKRIGDSHPFNWTPDQSNIFALEIRD